MHMKKFLAGVLACCVMGGALPYVANSADNALIAASEAGYTVGTYESLTYKNYGNYIEIADCDWSAKSVVIPAKIGSVPVTSIGDNAFSDCSILKSITIPNSVTSIGDWAFAECRGLTEIKIPTGVKNIGDHAFDGCLQLTSINIPDGIKSIGDFTFDSCKSLTEIKIPNSVKSIGISAFYMCIKLKSITIPANVKSIGDHAFWTCSELTEITILNPNCEIYDYNNTISNNVTNFNGTIYGYENSTAQAYAKKYNRKFVSLGEAPVPKFVMGDVNGDDTIDAKDASAVLAEYANLATGGSAKFDNSQQLAADVNNDKKIDSKDASKILAYYAAKATGGNPTW